MTTEPFCTGCHECDNVFQELAHDPLLNRSGARDLPRLRAARLDRQARAQDAGLEGGVGQDLRHHQHGSSGEAPESRGSGRGSGQHSLRPQLPQLPVVDFTRQSQRAQAQHSTALARAERPSIATRGSRIFCPGAGVRTAGLAARAGSLWNSASALLPAGDPRGFSVALWVLQYTGVLHAYLRGAAWHRHEMLFGYTFAVIAGFLLTARGWTRQPSRRPAARQPGRTLARRPGARPHALWARGRERRFRWRSPWPSPFRSREAQPAQLFLRGAPRGGGIH